MTNREYQFMLDLAELMDKYQVSIEATDLNFSVASTPSIQILNVDGNADGDISIDLYGCLYSADIRTIAKPE